MRVWLSLQKTVLSTGIKSLFIQFNEHCNDSSDGTLHAPTIYLHIYAVRCTQQMERTKDRKPQRSGFGIDQTRYHRTAVNLLALQFFFHRHRCRYTTSVLCSKCVRYDVHKQCILVCAVESTPQIDLNT